MGTSTNDFPYYRGLVCSIVWQCVYRGNAICNLSANSSVRSITIIGRLNMESELSPELSPTTTKPSGRSFADFKVSAVKNAPGEYREQGEGEGEVYDCRACLWYYVRSSNLSSCVEKLLVCSPSFSGLCTQMWANETRFTAGWKNDFRFRAGGMNF